MNAIEKKLSTSPVNLASTELIARLSDLIDLNGNKLFESTGSGIWVPSQNATGENTPAARVWYRRPVYHDISPQFFAGIRYIDFSIGLYLYLSTNDQDGNVVDPMQVMQDWTDTVLQSLQLKDDSATGWEWSADYWGPRPEQDIHPDYEDRMRRYNKSVPLEPPWYTVEIPFQVEVHNKQ